MLQISGRHFRKPGGELADGPGDAMGEINQSQKRDGPDGGGQRQEGVGEAAPQVARVLVGHTGASAGVFFLKVQHRDAVHRSRVDPDVVAVTDQVVQTIAAVAGIGEVLWLQPLEKNSRTGAGQFARSDEEKRSGFDATCSGILAKRLASALVQLAPGLLERF